LFAGGYHGVIGEILPQGRQLDSGEAALTPARVVVAGAGFLPPEHSAGNQRQKRGTRPVTVRSKLQRALIGTALLALPISIGSQLMVRMTSKSPMCRPPPPVTSLPAAAG
jgi:hypothetical protein